MPDPAGQPADPLALAGADQWHTLEGVNGDGKAVSLSVQHDGAVGKDEATKHCPVGSVIHCDTHEGRRSYVCIEHAPHPHGNFVVPRLVQAAGMPAPLALSSDDEGPVHWVTIDGEHVPIKGAAFSKLDRRTAVSSHEYDRVHGAGAAAKAIAEHRAAKAAGTAPTPPVEGRAGKGENGGMEAHEWTTPEGKHVTLEPNGEDAKLTVGGEEKRFMGYDRNAAGEPVAKYYNSAYDNGRVKLPEHLTHLAPAAESSPTPPAAPAEGPSSADYHHPGSGLHFKVRGDRVEVGGNTYDHRVALKRAGLDFDEEARVYRGHKSAVERLAIPRHWEVPAGLGMKVKNKIGRR